jgi:hypothetical protein
LTVLREHDAALGEVTHEVGVADGVCPTATRTLRAMVRDVVRNRRGAATLLTAIARAHAGTAEAESAEAMAEVWMLAACGR